MGKVVKTVLKVAAVAAIAYFAPPLAAKVGASVGISSALGTTAISTALGAGAGELAGVGWQSGALIGGLAGAGNTGLFGGKPTPAGGGGGGANAASTAGSAPASAGATGATSATTPAFEQAFSPTFEASLKAGVNPTAIGSAGTPTSIGGALSSAGSNPLNVVSGGLKNVSAGLGAGLGAVGISGGAAQAVAPALLGGALASAPMAGMAKAQEAELKRAQQVNAALTQQRMDQANQLIGEAAYYDPEYMARQAAEAAMIRGGVQTAEQTRGLTGERLAAERRRMALGTSRTAGSAYQQGYGTGVGARVQTRQAGIQSIPTEYALTNPAGAIAVGNAARSAKAEEEAALGALFGQVLGQGKTTSLGA